MLEKKILMNITDICTFFNKEISMYFKLYVLELEEYDTN